MLEIFIKGGPIMWPILICSIIALSVVIERMIFLFIDKRCNNQSKIEEIFKEIERGELESATAMASKCKCALGRTLHYGLKHRAISLSNALLRAATTELKKYNRGLSVLDTVITLAPLLGLLGTVTGMISAFGLLGGSELDAPVAITGGIAEALIATAFGLGVAILALIPFNFLNSRMEEVRHEIQDRATQLELLLNMSEPPCQSQIKLQVAA